MREMVLCGYCKKEFDRNNTVATLERFGKVSRFCSDNCADAFVIGEWNKKYGSSCNARG